MKVYRLYINGTGRDAPSPRKRPITNTIQSPAATVFDAIEGVKVTNSRNRQFVQIRDLVEAVGESAAEDALGEMAYYLDQPTAWVERDFDNDGQAAQVAGETFTHAEMAIIRVAVRLALKRSEACLSDVVDVWNRGIEGFGFEPCL